MDANAIIADNSDDASFNPRARDGREELKKTLNRAVLVSIHAPVMDAN